MSRKHKDALLRSDRILVGALAILAAAASAALGAAAAYHPTTNNPVPAVVAQSATPADLRLADDAADSVAPALASVQSAMSQPVIAKLLKEHQCLSEAMYYEARGEGVAGEKAVAEVIYRRLRSGNYGKSICDVVFAGRNRPGCQFSFACNGAMDRPKVAKSWNQAMMLAARIITSEERLGNTTMGATSFHATSVQPDWSHELVRTVQIGNHIFYRNPMIARTM